MVVRDLSAGVDGFNRWSFLNVGYLDGQWQLLQTWDVKNHKLLDNYTPYPNAYYFVGLLSRYTAKHSSVLASRVQGGTHRAASTRFAAALRSPKGNFTLAVVNDAPQAWEATVAIRDLAPRSPSVPIRRFSGRQRPHRSVIDPKAEFVVTQASSSFHDHWRRSR